jgi:26S proteasome regulatory subunit N9
LRQKVRIISFLELLFACNKDERSLSFERISCHCAIPVLDVELLVMKAMSLHLVRGVVDEVEEKVHIDWILPRFLNRGHLEIMRDKLAHWEQKMGEVINVC